MKESLGAWEEEICDDITSTTPWQNMARISMFSMSSYQALPISGPCLTYIFMIVVSNSSFPFILKRTSVLVILALHTATPNRHCIYTYDGAKFYYRFNDKMSFTLNEAFSGENKREENEFSYSY